MPGFAGKRRFARALRLPAVLASAALLAACGGGEEQQAAAPAKKSVDKPAAAAAKAPAPNDGPDSLKANAVVTGKTSAAVDLKFDVLSKPDPGQEFQIELVFLPRAPADSLEVEITSIPGITLVSGGIPNRSGTTAQSTATIMPEPSSSPASVGAAAPNSYRPPAM